MSILFRSTPEQGILWKDVFADLMPDMPFHIWPETGPLDEIEYILAWIMPDLNLDDLPRLKGVFSIGAGANQFNLNVIPEHVPLVRLVDPNTAQAVADYVAMAALALHRDLPHYIRRNLEGKWDPQPLRANSDRRIGIMGLGEMGRAAAERLAYFGFQLSGWSRRSKFVPGMKTYAGDQGLADFLATSDILVCLLPLTEQTRGILNETLFSRLPAGASLIQVGRGEHLDNDALLAALESGQIDTAFLDVTVPEPLPGDHPFWSHPRIVVTPHIAALTRRESAAKIIADNIQRIEDGEPPLGTVDRSVGY